MSTKVTGVSFVPAYRHSTKRRKSRATAYLLAHGRKIFERAFADDMVVASDRGLAMAWEAADAAAARVEADAAAARVELPTKRAREDAACAPRKKARIASVKESPLPTTEPLGSYWTTVPDRCGGNMISVRRSHRLSRS